MFCNVQILLIIKSDVHKNRIIFALRKKLINSLFITALAPA